MVSVVVDCGPGCLMQVSPVGLTQLWDCPRTYRTIPGLIVLLRCREFLQKSTFFAVLGRSRERVCCVTHGLVSPMPVLGLGRAVEKVWGSCAPAHCVSGSLWGRPCCRDGDLVSVELEAGSCCS